MSNGSIEFENKIFCNRSLNLSHVSAIGFDMDYTLAVYKPELENLAYTQTLPKLVNIGYPKEILEWKFDWQYMIRGLVIDKKRGNIIKMDRHRYVKVAYHGFERLAREERRGTYVSDVKHTYEEPDFAMVDTLFALADGFLFAQLVDLKNKKKHEMNMSYTQIYKDVRLAIDQSHRDGSIKSKVILNPKEYTIFDPNLKPLLQSIRAAGKKTFLVTNSLWNFTDSIMSFLLGESATQNNSDWLELFDVVITGSAKPSFFTNSNPIYEVDTSSGLLKNTDAICAKQKVYQGGNYKDLHDFLKISSGAQILYIGDHIYGDILRSKKDLGWRTMLVIQELAEETKRLEKSKHLLKNYENLHENKEQVEDDIQSIIKMLRINSLTEETEETIAEEEKLKDSLLALLKKKDAVREDLRTLMKTIHSNFHSVWGQLMKTGHQNSRFAAQVESYACLYTSKVTNLRLYHPNHSFRSTRDLMPHDS